MAEETIQTPSEIEEVQPTNEIVPENTSDKYKLIEADLLRLIAEISASISKITKPEQKSDEELAVAPDGEITKNLTLFLMAGFVENINTALARVGLKIAEIMSGDETGKEAFLQEAEFLKTNLLFLNEFINSRLYNIFNSFIQDIYVSSKKIINYVCASIPSLTKKIHSIWVKQTYLVIEKRLKLYMNTTAFMSSNEEFKKRIISDIRTNCTQIANAASTGTTWACSNLKDAVVSIYAHFFNDEQLPAGDVRGRFIKAILSTEKIREELDEGKKNSIVTMFNNINEKIQGMPVLNKSIAYEYLAKISGSPEFTDKVIKYMYNNTLFDLLTTFTQVGSVSSQESLRILFRHMAAKDFNFAKSYTNNFSKDSKFFKDYEILSKALESMQHCVSGLGSKESLANILEGSFKIERLESQCKKIIMFSDFVHNNTEYTPDGQNSISLEEFKDMYKTLLNIAEARDYCKIVKGIIDAKKVVASRLGGTTNISPEKRKELLAILTEEELNRILQAATISFSECKKLSINDAKLISASSFKLDNKEVVEKINETLEEKKDEFAKYKPLKDLLACEIDGVTFRAMDNYSEFPRMLMIGAETNCCQLLGGAAAWIAIDSVTNPQAGVLVAEYGDAILAQSYITVMERDEGKKIEFILDNVESNPGIVTMFETQKSTTLSNLYKKFAKELKNRLGDKMVDRVICGTGCSDLRNNEFSSADFKEDRPFVENEGWKDCGPGKAMDLLRPTTERSEGGVFDNY